MCNCLIKIKKKTADNSGFSIAEFLVAAALLSMVVFTTVMLMSAGSNMFTVTNKLINLQYKSQTAMSQFQQYFMGADGGVTEDGNTYYIADKADNKIIAFEYNAADSALYLISVSKDAFVSNGYSLEGFDRQPLCTGVSGFNVETRATAWPVSLEYSKQATSASITLELTQQDKQYTANQIYSFRNTICYITGINTERTDSSKLETFAKEVWDNE